MERDASLSARRAWIEMFLEASLSLMNAASLSARRAWIEISFVQSIPRGAMVALRKESVDRNTPMRSLRWLIFASLSARRAWIEITTRTRMPIGCVSLSARRAWIEISRIYDMSAAWNVALRKESVDRN